MQQQNSTLHTKKPCCFSIVPRGPSCPQQHFCNFPSEAAHGWNIGREALCCLWVRCVFCFAFAHLQIRQVKFRSVSGPRALCFLPYPFILVAVKIHQHEPSYTALSQAPSKLWRLGLKHTSPCSPQLSCSILNLFEVKSRLRELEPLWMDLRSVGCVWEVSGYDLETEAILFHHLTLLLRDKESFPAERVTPRVNCWLMYFENLPCLWFELLTWLAFQKGRGEADFCWPLFWGKHQKWKSKCAFPLLIVHCFAKFGKAGCIRVTPFQICSQVLGPSATHINICLLDKHGMTEQSNHKHHIT